MIFDIIILVLLLVFLFNGYNKGLVSILLALGLYAISFLVTIFINSQYLLFDSLIGMWVQGLIIYILLLVLSNTIVKAIDFEELAIIGVFSKILGAIFYGAIFMAIVSFVVLVYLSLPNAGQAMDFIENSYLVSWLKNIF
ncbi:MAG: CvpA family protein [Culicoidibacterales bacterium]